jgi:HAD superfamily phosphatase (TIGR01668 family)
MAFSLLPTIIIDSVTQLTPEMLHQRGIRLLMLDFDNTIVPYTSDVPTPLMAAWLAWVKDCGMYVCVVSNSKRDRVRIFCKKHGLDCITHAKKPFKKGIRQCLNKYGIAPSEAALVGDQIFTDTLGANGCGVQSILIKAIDNHNIWLKLRHVAELPFIFLARKRRIKT